MGFLGLGLELVFLEETYPPVILVNKAANLRRRTKNWGVHAKQEEIEIDLRELLEKNLDRPMRMLFTEPLVLALSVYMAFVYGLLYLFLTFYPIVFQQIHGMNPGVGGVSLALVIRTSCNSLLTASAAPLRHDHWRALGRRLHDLDPAGLQPKASREQQYAHPRVEVAASHHWGYVLMLPAVTCI